MCLYEVSFLLSVHSTDALVATSTLLEMGLNNVS